ncbi:unnamed protein product [Vitrella brassicaformis CCMP3155]|uniref:Stress-associated endoplasmic reticulum protein n=1 Tax=Vitrella brassicaformis (strain CCMP3155) TaxID=1169540 RepID=A0A0G4GWW2_VITBC|nr:unnamed protein product [Vitrella brassicaformis CCMP3155]|eukprot:CEM35340.1 unnamed protein product [Vitrella brassicaformis CCMP3155]
MPAPRKQQLKSSQFEKNISKRGMVPTSKDKKNRFAVGPAVLAVFLFVVVGSAVLQIIASATRNQVF